jgi:hypothetical protein
MRGTAVGTCEQSIAEAEAKIAGGWEGFAARLRRSYIDLFEEKIGKGGFDPYVATWTCRRDLAEEAARSNQYVGARYTGQTDLVAIVPVVIKSK